MSCRNDDSGKGSSGLCSEVLSGSSMLFILLVIDAAALAAAVELAVVTTVAPWLSPASLLLLLHMTNADPLPHIANVARKAAPVPA